MIGSTATGSTSTGLLWIGLTVTGSTSPETCVGFTVMGSTVVVVVVFGGNMKPVLGVVYSLGGTVEVGVFFRTVFSTVIDDFG